MLISCAYPHALSCNAHVTTKFKEAIDTHKLMFVVFSIVVFTKLCMTSFSSNLRYDRDISCIECMLTLINDL